MSAFKGSHYVGQEISDDPDYPAAPLAVSLPDAFAEREYESFGDGYFHMTPDEAAELLGAIQDALDKRVVWLLNNPNGIAELQAQIDAEEAADWSGPGWFYKNSGGSGWCPGLPEHGDKGALQIQIDRAAQGNGVARFVPDGATDPDVQALRESVR